MDRCGERAKRLVGANVGGGFLAADMLLARGERQDEAAAAFGVGGLAREAAGHLANKLSREATTPAKGPP